MGNIVRYVGMPALYESEETVENQVGFVREQPTQDELTLIPETRRLLSPPVVTSHRLLLNALTAMSRLAMTPAEARGLDKMALTCVRISFDGKETIVVEAASRAEHGVVKVKAKCRQPSTGWSVLVPADAAAQTVGSLPKRPLEVAPGERFYVGNLSIQMMNGEFPERPVIPQDVDDGEAREVAFQSIVSKVGLRDALNFCSPIIRMDRQSNLQHLVIDPEKKLAGSTDADRANLQQIDVRSRPRLGHPEPFMLTLSAARAATIVDEDDFVFVSMMSAKDVVIAGRKNQSYSIVINQRIQSGLPFLLFDFWPWGECSEFVVKYDDIAGFCQKACDIFHGTEEEAAARIYFGEGFMRCEAVQRELGSEVENVDWEIKYVRTKQVALQDRRFYLRPDWLMEAVRANKGSELTILLPRNAKSDDRIMFRGPDTSRVTAISPINPDPEDHYE